MPIYEYVCMECESHFEELVRSSEQAVTCPDCGAANVLKQFSTFAVGVGSRSASSSSVPAPAPRAGGGCCGGGCGCAH